MKVSHILIFTLPACCCPFHELVHFGGRSKEPTKREKHRAGVLIAGWSPLPNLENQNSWLKKVQPEITQIRKFQPGKPSPLKWTCWLDPHCRNDNETVGSTGSLLVKHRGFEGLMIWLHQHWQKFLWEPSWLGVVFSSAPLFSQWYSPCQIKNLPQIRTLTHHVTWLSLSLDLQLYWRQLAVAQDPKDDAI